MHQQINKNTLNLRVTESPIATKIGKVVGVHDVIICCKFGFNIFRGFRSTAGQNFRFPIDFAGHRYNSAAGCDVWAMK